jgi:hypothetical protein
MRSKLGSLPYLFVGTDEQTGLDGNSILDAIRRKGPRLTVVVVEACNRSESPYGQGSSEPVAASASAEESYRALFKEARGEFVAMAAQPGEFAYLNRSEGGFFTNAFVGALKYSQTWKAVAATLRQPITVSPSSGKSASVVQQPRVEWKEAGIPRAFRPPPSPPPALATPVMVKVGDDIYAARDLVTVAQFRAFIEATGYTTSGPCKIEHLSWRNSNDYNWRSPGFTQTDNYPVVCVSYTDASAYAKWLSKITGSDYRLMPLDWWEIFAQKADPSKDAVAAAHRGRLSHRLVRPDPTPRA